MSAGGVRAVPGTSRNGLPLHDYRKNLRAAPDPEPVAARVLAALSALGGAGTVKEVGLLAQLETARTAWALRSLSRRSPPEAGVLGSPAGGGGRARLWYLGPEPPPGDAVRGRAAAPVLTWPEARRAGRNARALRRRAGLTQAETARRAGVSPTALCQFEAGRQRLGEDHAESLALALGSALGDLTGERCAACRYMPGTPGCKATCGGAP